jgi:hypothetical protein
MDSMSIGNEIQDLFKVAAEATASKCLTEIYCILTQHQYATQPFFRDYDSERWKID